MAEPYARAMPDLADLEARAADHLEHSAYDYFRGGSDEEWTLAANRAAWDACGSGRTCCATCRRCRRRRRCSGSDVATPVLVAPTAYHELASPLGESGPRPGRRRWARS